MRPTLPLWERLNGRVPCIAAHPRRLVDWDPEIVAQLRSRHALRLVFPEPRRPLTREVDLRPRRRSVHRDQQKNRHDENASNDAHTAPNVVPTAAHPRREQRALTRAA